MFKSTGGNPKILKIIDELLNQKKENQSISPELKNKINSLSESDLLEFINLYNNIKRYEESTEKKLVPDFYLFKIKDYYDKQKVFWKEEKLIPAIIIKFVKNQFELLHNSLPELQFATESFQLYRSGSAIQSKKIIWNEEKDNSKIEYSLIPQENSFLLSIYFQNLEGQLTLKVKKENSVIDIMRFSNLKSQERIFLDNLSYGNYYLLFNGAYNKEFQLKIVK